MPNSVSVPSTRMRFVNVWSGIGPLKIVAGTDGFNLPMFGGPTTDGPDMNDFLALLSGDFRPIVRIGRVGEILVLLELLTDGADQVVRAQAGPLLRDHTFHGKFFRARN